MSRLLGHAVFDTPIGACALAWSETGIARVALPDVDRSATARHMAGEAPETDPPPWIAGVVLRIRSHLGGRLDDLIDVPLDVEDRPSFHRKVWERARCIRPGATRTYGEIAKAVGSPGAARAVGQALGNNPVPILVPCHRVLAAGGAPGGFSAPGGLSTKARLLALEGAQLELVRLD